MDKQKTYFHKTRNWIRLVTSDICADQCTEHHKRHSYRSLDAPNRETRSLLRLLGPFIQNDSWQLLSLK